MPDPDETRPCTVDNCPGTQRWVPQERHTATGSGDKDDKIAWRERIDPPGWHCDSNDEHYDPNP